MNLFDLIVTAIALSMDAFAGLSLLRRRFRTARTRRRALSVRKRAQSDQTMGGVSFEFI